MFQSGMLLYHQFPDPFCTPLLLPRSPVMLHCDEKCSVFISSLKRLKRMESEKNACSQTPWGYLKSITNQNKTELTEILEKEWNNLNQGLYKLPTIVFSCFLKSRDSLKSMIFINTHSTKKSSTHFCTVLFFIVVIRGSDTKIKSLSLTRNDVNSQLKRPWLTKAVCSIWFFKTILVDFIMT